MMQDRLSDPTQGQASAQDRQPAAAPLPPDITIMQGQPATEARPPVDPGAADAAETPAGPGPEYDLEAIAQRFVAQAGGTGGASGADRGGDADGALEAMATLADNDGAVEADEPSPESLTNETPALTDIPDAPSAGDDDPTDPMRAVPGGAEGAAPDPAEGIGPDIDHIEAAAFAHESASPSSTLPFDAVEAAATIPDAQTTERMSGAAKGTGSLAWGSRTDVGRVREHNEDSFLVQFPLFAIADGMGGHAAGEVASTIAVSSLAADAPSLPDAPALGAAIESANAAVIQGAESGLGRAGMGTTLTAVVIDGDQMAVGHVGDSRCYLLHAGQLVRVTHDHSYVEELVAAGKITPEEARFHPNRSVITRALGSDANMLADAFTIDLARGDRVMLCSDGLNSMIADDVIEEAMVSTPTPQNCADTLVDLALDAGGFDNVTCIVVDVKDDGTDARALRLRTRNILIGLVAVALIMLAVFAGMYLYSQNTWYLDDEAGYVTLHRGIPGDWGALPFNETVETTGIATDKLSEAVESRLHGGMAFSSEDDARVVIDDYRKQIEEAETSKAEGAKKIDDARRAAGEGVQTGEAPQAETTEAMPASEEAVSQDAQAGAPDGRDGSEGSV